mmetsp:Transcript_18591/g.28715  ORF Transcript_18591/g.28715 Transcript_18591/m.28715 type:complete len:563 (+) Transcript_18591:105-1793(+)|eukprot:CAMPEP_0195305022 /NCGR_PEP_ID=MMETSP0707-20130614/35556_1 /TAXON_ID=33640 /ORGANISM="Asterionellopsis glacialis, Strain CCMP134" /LENGTH=562 /DNA_ID=CAMNT_0040369025 /DNA_START=90 /DNA_END=1778 /DNA_ORIENTATION=-
MGRPKRNRSSAVTGNNATNCDNNLSTFDDAEYGLQQQQQQQSREFRGHGGVTTKSCAQLSSTNDCYDETMMLHGRPQYVTSLNPITIRSSWLNNVVSFQEYFSQATAISTNSANTGTPNDHTANNEQEVSRKDQIEGSYRQLCQIKRRLWPAAEQCATGGGSDAISEFQEARCVCNPFEGLGQGRNNRIFMNRAALKLCNIDALLGFLLTRHHDDSGIGKSICSPFVFADICGAPGGFSEYIMYRCRQNNCGMKTSCKGYGMSLLGTNEHGSGVPWNLQNLQNSVTHNGNHDSSANANCSFRVCQGMDGTGDIYRWENIESLCKEIYADLWNSNTTTPRAAEIDNAQHGALVHLVVADGGFDAQRDSENQEELAQKIVVCQATAAIVLLKQGGTFVLKMFGFRTPTIRFLMEELLNVFDDILVLKPISSRPASAERYVVFMGYKGTIDLTNGLLWRNQVFLGVRRRTTFAAGGGDNESMECNDDNNDLGGKQREIFHLYLDEMDHSMLRLNSSTCFQILSYLQRKYQATMQNNDTHQFNIQSTGRRGRSMDFANYKRTWKIE